MLNFGPYEVHEELGRGGMGVVYRGFDPLIRRDVALKTIKLYDISEESERRQMQERLEREAQSAGRLSHPSIVTIYQIGYQELRPGQPVAFVAMEYVPGRTLSALLEKTRVVHNTVALSLLRQAAAGLDYAHSRGVIHRDVKPANLLITADGCLKITDFGVAKLVSQTMTVTGTVLGSPFYMAPEQIRGERVSGHSDQYSLAVVAYEIFGGRRPFQADSLSALVYKIVHEPPPRLELEHTEMARRLNPVLQRAMAKEPHERFPDCAAFVDALEHACREPLSPAAPQPAAPQPPAHQSPAPQPPALQPPVHQPPAHQPPAHQPPAHQSPATQPPAHQPPARQSPAPQPAVPPPPIPQPPALQPPALQPPALQPPATQPSAPQPPAPQPPAPQPPALQPPAHQPPAPRPVATPAPPPVEPPQPLPASPFPPPAPAPVRTPKAGMRAPWAAISAGLAVVVVMVAGVKFLGSGQRPDQPAQPAREVQQAPPAPSQPGVPGPQVPKSTQEPAAGARKPASPPAKLASLAATPVKPEPKPAPPPANPVRPATQPASSAGRPAAKPAQQAQLLPEVQKSAPPSSPPPAATTPAQPPDLPAAPAPAPVQQAAQEPPRAPVRTSPVLLQRTPSPYTDQARRAGLEGAVQLSVDVDDRGIPIRARVLKSLDPGLDRNAIQSLAGWRFQPATEDGKPVGATVKVEVQFSLVGAPGRRIPSLKAKKN